ncbi:MAG: hypothetical protein FWE67_14945 [Planctomycetaceae bacterium]|nr:hypothetical protein [Planctomycetaceae bacterium]
MFRLIPITCLVVASLFSFPAVVKSAESAGEISAPTSERARLTFAMSEIKGLKHRIEEHRLDPDKVKLSDYDLRYFSQKELPPEFEGAITEKEWKEITAETAVIVWLRRDAYASSDVIKGYVLVDHQGAYRIENASVKWKAIEKSTGKELGSGTEEGLSFRHETVRHACEFEFDLAKAGITSVPSEFVIEAELEFSNEKKNAACPFTGRQAVPILNSGQSAKKLTGGVFGGNNSKSESNPRPFFGLF